MKLLLIAVIGIWSSIPVLAVFLWLRAEYQIMDQVTISSTTSGVMICYTKDGETPTTTGTGVCTHGTTR